MTKKRLLLGGLLFLFSLLAYGAYALSISGELREIKPHFNGSCRMIPGVVGPEDIEILSSGAGALISSQDRRAHLNGGAANGAIYYYDLTQKDAKPINLLPNAPEKFRPHGIGIYEGEIMSLFVVNHPRGDVHGDLPGEGPAHSIEVYEFDPTVPSLKHLRSVTDPELLITPNDVAPVGPNRFYATNDHGTGDKAFRVVEDYLRLKRSHIVYFDGVNFSRLPGGYRYANGIIATRDGKRVYMAAPADRTLYVFERNQVDNSLFLTREIFAGSAVDNPTLDENGHLWLGAHPKMFTLGAHFGDAEIRSPSQVLRIDPEAEGDAAVEEIFLSDGVNLSASSSAARRGDRLLIGSVMDPGFLDCVMNAPN